jgi:serine phosphatase RsbU (regulator of sigma subunit)
MPTLAAEWTDFKEYWSPMPLDPDEVSRRAFEKWISRRSVENSQQRDWLEAEAELRRFHTLTRELAQAQTEVIALRLLRVDAERWLSAARVVSHLLGTARSLDEVASPLLQALCVRLGWDAGLLWLCDGDDSGLRCIGTWSQHAPLDSKEFGGDVASRVCASEGPVWIHDLCAEVDIPGEAFARAIGLHACVAFPIQHDGGLLGVLQFYDDEVVEPDGRILVMLAAIALEISQYIRRLSIESRLRKQEHEQRLAEEIQRGLLPHAFPDLPDFEISGRMVPADAVGGDFYDVIPDSTGVLIVVADASGHGLGAALLAVQTRAYLRALCLTRADPGQLLELTNVRLSQDLHSSHFVTAILVTLDVQARSLAYSNAGHPSGVVLDQEGQVRELLSSIGPPLGVDLQSAFTARSMIALWPGDLLLLMTDGILESPAANNELFGIERTLDVVRRHRHESPDQIVTALLEAVSDFSHRRQEDDRTAVIIKVRDRQVAGRSAG